MHECMDEEELIIRDRILGEFSICCSSFFRSVDVSKVQEVVAALERVLKFHANQHPKFSFMRLTESELGVIHEQLNRKISFNILASTLNEQVFCPRVINKDHA